MTHKYDYDNNAESFFVFDFYEIQTCLLGTLLTCDTSY